MKFVKGKPFKNCRESLWYLRIENDPEVHDFVFQTIENSRLAKDPHLDPKFATEHSLPLVGMAMIAISRVVLDVAAGKRDGYYMNINGGMTSSLFDIEQEVEAKYFPNENRIKINRWPTGKHFYAKVDGVDVVWRGKQNWNTAKAAENAAVKFLEEKDKNESKF